MLDELKSEGVEVHAKGLQCKSLFRVAQRSVCFDLLCRQATPCGFVFPGEWLSAGGTPRGSLRAQSSRKLPFSILPPFT